MYNVFVYNLLVRNNVQTDSAGDFLLLRSTHKKGCEMQVLYRRNQHTASAVGVIYCLGELAPKDCSASQERKRLYWIKLIFFLHFNWMSLLI